MNIVISCNKKYNIFSFCLLDSFFKYNIGNHQIYFLVPKNELISKKYINKLNTIVNKNNSKLDILEINDSLFLNLPISKRFPINIYYRLLIPFILPEHINDVVWLDCDILINSTINIPNLDHYCIAGVNDLNFEICKKRLSTKVYINSGVLFFNIKNIRKVLDINKLIDFMRTNSDKLIWPDQDLINLYFSKQENGLYLLDKSYNYQIFPSSNITLDLLIKENAHMYHFVGSPKPNDVRYKNKEIVKFYLNYYNKYSNKYIRIIQIIFLKLFYNIKKLVKFLLIK